MKLLSYLFAGALLPTGFAAFTSTESSTKPETLLTLSSASATIQSNCKVTLPNGNTPPGEQSGISHHGNGSLWTVLTPNGKIVFSQGGPPATPGSIEPDGSLSAKFPWWRGVRGRLTIEGRRLDASAPPLRANILDGYGEIGFQSTGIIFPTEGCWEVTGKVGDAILTFVTQAIKAKAATSVSAASFLGTALAAESITSAFGTGLASATVMASTSPLPTVLGGTSVKIVDSRGVERSAPLFAVSPGQVNFLIPSGTLNGRATVIINNENDQYAIGTTQIVAVAPGLFAANANGQGVAAAVALRFRADGSQTTEALFRFDASQNKFVSVPLDLGPESDQVFLILFGTGMRFRSSLSAVAARVGGTDAHTTYAGAQGDFVGLDQVNLQMPRSLIGRGEVDLALTVDGQIDNTVRVNIK